MPSVLSSSARSLSLISALVVTLGACGSSSSGDGDGAGGSGRADGGATGSGGGADGGGSGSGGNGSGSGSDGGSGGSGPGGTDGDGGSGSGVVADTFGGVFRHGMNDGHVNPNWTDNQGGALGIASGADSNRMKLPEYFLDQWGVGVRTDAATSYVSGGMSDLVCFLIGPSQDHSTAPANSDTGTLEQYIPTNLYEPIFAADGSVNPANYWAKYVEETVTAYKPWVRIWEVWNEPDWTPDYSTTQGWATAAPTVADLPRFNGAIFDYIRMLRVTYAVAKKVDPTAQVALGGIGYPTFLSALLRYTDQPMTGAVSADYPARGDAYFDVLNFHYYPLYTPGNSDAAADGFLSLKSQFQAVMTAAGVTGKSWNATETGAPRYALGTSPGGEDYAKNYILKVMLDAHLAGMIGVDWFLLSDGAQPGASTDPYQYMGLYQDIASLSQPSDAVKTSTGVAYSTLGLLLKGATVDQGKTTALALPATVKGGAFHTTAGHTVVALWAVSATPTTTSETATASYSLATTGSVTAYAWDYSTTKSTTTIASSNGKATLSLTATPQFFDVP